MVLLAWPAVVGMGALALGMARCTASASSVVADGLVSATLSAVASAFTHVGAASRGIGAAVANRYTGA